MQNPLHFSMRDLQDQEKLVFEDNVPVEMLIEKIVQDEKVVTLDVTVLDGTNRGKFHDIRLWTRTPRGFVSKEWKTFSLSFFTSDQLLTGKANLNDLVNHKFTATPKTEFYIDKKDGSDKSVQRWGDFKDLGVVVDEGF